MFFTAGASVNMAWHGARGLAVTWRFVPASPIFKNLYSHRLALPLGHCSVKMLSSEVCQHARDAAPSLS